MNKDDIERLKNLDFTKTNIHDIHWVNDHATVNPRITPISFDIEFTNLGRNGAMYAFSLSIGNDTIIGRTWEDFDYIIDTLVKANNISAKGTHLVIYIQYMAVEFAYMRKRYNWVDTFLIDKYEPIRLLTDKGVEFRDMLVLCGKELKEVAKDLEINNLTKADDYDYKKIRHSLTPLTTKELDYIAKDTLIMNAYLRDMIIRYRGLNGIPFTQTGTVRRLIRSNCFYKHVGKNKYHNKEYINAVQRLKVSEGEAEELKAARKGAYTYVNPCYRDFTTHNVYSIDRSSAFIHEMIANKYPMSNGYKLTDEELKKVDRDYLLNHMVLFKCTLYNVKAKYDTIAYIDIDKCDIEGNVVTDLDKIVTCDKLSMIMTNVAYETINSLYEYDRIEVGDVYTYKAGYLPKELIITLSSMYKSKTELKGIKGKASKYNMHKSRIASVYGCMATDINRPSYKYTDDYSGAISNDEAENLLKYNNDKSRFYNVLWSLWIIDYADKTLIDLLKYIADDFVLCNADCIKMLNHEQYKDLVNYYNSYLIDRTDEMLKYYNLPLNTFSPSNINGVVKPIGVFEPDGYYIDFKAIGAKRYIYTDINGDITATISGVSKYDASKYLNKLNESGVDVYTYFKNGFEIPAEYSGKMIVYHSDGFKDTITDYTGITADVCELSSMSLEPIRYRIDMEKSNNLKRFKIASMIKGG